MALRKALVTASVALIASVAAPSKASADWLLTPFVGWNWGAAANLFAIDQLDDEFEQRADYGVSFGWMGAGAIGWEIDLSYSPNFFESTIGSSSLEFGNSNLTTVMGNVVVGIPIGGQHGAGFRPYAVGGVGLIKSRIGGADDLFDVHSNDFGINVGAGAILFLGDGFGLRGDVRYFRSLQDNSPESLFDIALSDFRYWRGSVGATFRF